VLYVHPTLGQLKRLFDAPSQRRTQLACFAGLRIARAVDDLADVLRAAASAARQLGSAADLSDRLQQVVVADLAD